jgi:hypothetical protein
MPDEEASPEEIERYLERREIYVITDTRRAYEAQRKLDGVHVSDTTGEISLGLVIRGPEGQKKRHTWLSDTVTGQITAEPDAPDELTAEVRHVVDAWFDRNGGG